VTKAALTVSDVHRANVSDFARGVGASYLVVREARCATNVLLVHRVDHGLPSSHDHAYAISSTHALHALDLAACPHRSGRANVARS